MSSTLYNRRHYDLAWEKYRIPEYAVWPHWKAIKKYIRGNCLEIGPGARPKLPIRGSFFVDISPVIIKRLKSLGAKGIVSDLSARLSFRDSFFSLVLAFEVLEHLPNDRLVLKDLTRVLKKGGKLVVSFPLNMKFFGNFDKTVGHYRRYDPVGVERMFSALGLKIRKYSAIDITWPTGILARILSALTKYFPGFVLRMGEYLDGRKDASVKRKIELKTWSIESYKELLKVSTGFFICEKV